MKTISIASDKLDDRLCDVALLTGEGAHTDCGTLVISSRHKTVRV